MYRPSYVGLYERGELEARAEMLAALAAPCHLCPQQCRVDRTAEKLGVCGSPLEARVSSAFAHFGEEEVLVGRCGSGTIFFCGCSLRCSFCQNWEISHGLDSGRSLNAEELAAVMLELQGAGCHNINFVTPTHYVHAILAALTLAAAKGLEIPLVYNCGGYESLETLALLEGVIDIYMPDVKFYDDRTAARYMLAKDYGSRAREALKAMHAQVGDLRTGLGGTACRGLLIRHLILPEWLAGTGRWAAWIARELSPDSYVNLMDQYRPCFAAVGDERLGRRPGAAEYRAAVQQALEAGLSGRGFERLI